MFPLTVNFSPGVIVPTPTPDPSPLIYKSSSSFTFVNLWPEVPLSVTAYLKLSKLLEV